MVDDTEDRKASPKRCLPRSIVDLLPESLVPPETRRHVRAARREFLLALRSWIDAMVQDLEEQERVEARRRPTRIEIR
jgi:hypothetical protein